MNRYPTWVERARDYVAFSALPGSIVFGICDFFSRQQGAWVQFGIGALALIVATGLLMLVMAASQSPRAAQILERVVSSGAHYQVWNSAKPLRSHGVHLVAIFGAMCVLLAGQTIQKQQEGGVLAGQFAVIGRMQSVLNGISDTLNAPAEVLTRAGYDTSFDGMCRALLSNDAAVIPPMVKLQPTLRLSKPVGEGNFHLCIEEALVEGQNLQGLLPGSGLTFDGKDINRVYASQTMGFQKPGPLNVAAVVTKAGRKWSRVQLMEVAATPLMFAVWSGNAQLVQALLERGAQPDLASRLTVIGGVSPINSGLHHVFVTPLAEARRLGAAPIVRMLEEVQAKADVRITDFMQSS